MCNFKLLYNKLVFTCFISQNLCRREILEILSKLSLEERSPFGCRSVVTNQRWHRSNVSRSVDVVCALDWMSLLEQHGSMFSSTFGTNLSSFLLPTANRSFPNLPHTELLFWLRFESAYFMWLYWLMKGSNTRKAHRSTEPNGKAIIAWATSNQRMTNDYDSNEHWLITIVYTRKNKEQWLLSASRTFFDPTAQ